MKPIEIIATDLFEKVRSRFTNLQMGDEAGSVTADPAQARFFDFDFSVEGNNLGRVSISINETGSLKVFYSQSILENADSVTETMWFDFLKEMRYFAKRRLLRFDTRDITKGNLDKTDFQYLAKNEPKDDNMNESTMFGSTKTSHRKVEDTDLIIRHSEAIDPNQKGARSRKIKNLFIQNKEGERFKFPFVYLPGARAMQRHVANGGYPHDEVGKHIIETCEEILKLSDFGRKVRNATLNDNAHGIIERAGGKLKQLRHHMESLARQGYYESWKESYAPDEGLTELDDVTFESYKDAFTQNKFDEALAEVFPLLHKIMQETSELDLTAVVSEDQSEETTEDAEYKDEFAAFESWSDAVAEGTLEPDSLMRLKDLLDNNSDLTIGADGTTGIEALEGIGIVDEQLEQLIQAKAGMQNGPEVLLKDVVSEWLVQDDPEAAQELGLVPGQQAPVQQAEPAPLGQPAQSEETGNGDWDDEYVNTGSPFPDRDDDDLDTYGGEHDPDVNESAYFGPEDYQDWLKDAVHRVAHGKVADWTELYTELVNDLNFDENKAERIAQRIYGHDKLSQHRVKPEVDVDLPTDTDDTDDDAAFLAQLRGQARKGSIAPGADTGEVDEEDSIEHDPEDKLIEKGSDHDIWKAVEGFLDKEKGTWTKGRPGIVAHVAREFGDAGAKKAAKAIIILSKKFPMQDEPEAEKTDEAMEDILKLAGLPVVEGKKPSAGLTKKEKSATVKKAKAGKDIGKAGKGFAKVEKAAKKGGAKDPKAVAAAAMWKNLPR